ncbi:DUF262 domain-containing protein [Clostridium tertium]|uniref:DUF262 domain-containing protein n=1 Tax=Clostridium tertium TaxID=1559 RepID=UPI002A80DADC|nr:DUF262 domain-containing protein [Clostridium tertium]MDY4604031.1 DUF262 domain-containing protein [Clostridium tertium]
MRINEELLKAASFNPTKRTYQITISNLCEKIENEEITLPLYQRDVSWTIEKAVDLLNYQMLGPAPVSPISVNEINNTEDGSYVVQISFIDREIIKDIKRGQLSITDGQQRLTTNYKAYINHEDFRNIVLDLSKGCFTFVDKELKKNQIPVGMLLNKDTNKLFEYINKNSVLSKPEIINVLLQIRGKIRDYNYTVNLAEDLTEDEQINWFEVLNNAGSRVTRIQMRFSKLKVEGIDIYTQYTKKFKDIIEGYGLDLFKVKDTEVSIPVAALNPAYELIMNKIHTNNYTPIPSDARENQLCNLNSKKLLKCFEITLIALNNTMKLIDDNKLKYPTRLDYITYLTGAFVFKNNSFSKEEEKKIIEWYGKVDFKNKSNSERRAIFSELLKLLGVEVLVENNI